MLGAPAVTEFGGPVELLAARAVQAVVPLTVQIAGVGAGQPETSDARPVAGVAAGADDVVDGQRQRVAEGQECIAVAVDELPHWLASRLRGEDVLERVVIGPCLEPDAFPAPATIAGQHVGLHQLEREPDVRARVDVRDRGGDIGMRRGHRSLLGRAPSA